MCADARLLCRCSSERDANRSKIHIHCGNFILHFFLYIEPLANEFSNHFFLRCDTLFLYPILASENEAEDFVGGYADVETTSGARHRDQEARRTIDNIFPLVNRKNNNGMVGAGRAVNS